jgi:hypothetical protein|tara:strand:+ start:1052 stop:1153 length:102 start_codon:yes stop_codon:yes gene_type:complete
MEKDSGKELALNSFYLTIIIFFGFIIATYFIAL